MAIKKRMLKNHWDVDYIGFQYEALPDHPINEALAKRRQDNVQFAISVATSEWAKKYWNNVLNNLQLKYGNKLDVLVN